MYPEDFVEQLQTLQGRHLRERESGWVDLSILEKAPVRNYRTGYPNNHTIIRSALNKYLGRKADDPKSCVFRTGEEEWALYCDDPVYCISSTSILRVLTGKGTVHEILDVLKVVSLMLQEQKPNKALLGCTGLRQFVEDYVGHDCNGFVFSYLRAAHSHQAKTDKKCGQYREGTLRRSLNEIREFDMLFPPDAGHVLITGRILERTSKHVECYISESRGGGMGGAQSHRYRIKPIAGGKWLIDFRDRMEVSRTMGWIYGSPLVNR